MKFSGMLANVSKTMKLYIFILEFHDILSFFHGIFFFCWFQEERVISSRFVLGGFGSFWFFAGGFSLVSMF